jgi:hypothetical protein
MACYNRDAYAWGRLLAMGDLFVQSICSSRRTVLAVTCVASMRPFPCLLWATVRDIALVLLDVLFETPPKTARQDKASLAITGIIGCIAVRYGTAGHRFVLAALPAALPAARRCRKRPACEHLFVVPWVATRGKAWKNFKSRILKLLQHHRLARASAVWTSPLPTDPSSHVVRHHRQYRGISSRSHPTDAVPTKVIPHYVSPHALPRIAHKRGSTWR